MQDRQILVAVEVVEQELANQLLVVMVAVV
jgi:hypothetical protein